ncbi:MAG TPA: non-homologous end-joining DNA ligase, partial [Chloroflexota bacterium]
MALPTSRRRSSLHEHLAHPLPPAPLPPAPRPMLATLVDKAFDHPDWIFEPKFDGLRILARFDGRRLTLLSRNGPSQNLPFPDIEQALRDSLKQPAIVDGEVVCFDEHGQTSFQALPQRFHLQDRATIRQRARPYPASLYLFDLLYLDHFDLTSRPLHERKHMLRQAVQWLERVRWTEYQRQQGQALFQRACREGGEGIIGKQFHSLYLAGRSADWVKIKCIGRQEFVIGGFTEPQRSRIGLGALLVGYYREDGERLVYAGKVGSGYTRQTLLDLRQRLEALEQTVSPFAEGALSGGGPVHWVQPVLVAEIAFAAWTQHGLLRQPRFEGLRPDKTLRECRRERPRYDKHSRTSAADHPFSPGACHGTRSIPDQARLPPDARANRHCCPTPS